jgi:predicted nucleic-acid-binding protein
MLILKTGGFFERKKEQCIQQKLMKNPSVVIDKNQAIYIANEFLKTHKISFANYGSAKVWKNSY